MRVRDQRATRKGADRDKTWWNFYQRNRKDLLLTEALAIVNAVEIALLKTRVSTNETDIAALDTRVTTNEADIASLDTRVTINEGDIDALQRPPVEVLSASTVLTESQHYVRVDTQGVTITLAASPGEGWQHDIRNTSGGTITVDPNGNNLEGSTDTQTVYDGETFNLIYDTADGWRL
jgi:hypothetical protein